MTKDSELRCEEVEFDAGKKLRHYLVATSSPGYWGKGPTVKEAIANAQWIETGDRVELFRITPDVYMNELGNICGRTGDKFIHVTSGKVGHKKSAVVAAIR